MRLISVNLATKFQTKGERFTILSPPTEFQSDLEDGQDALLAFAKDETQLRELAKMVQDYATADRQTWVAYPKGKQMGTDLNRDKLNAILTEYGIRPVRQVSIDDTWSAMRFRPGVYR